MKKLDQSQVELTITVTPADYASQLESAAVRISERAAIKGFRKGHVPYDIVKREMGEMNILQEALEPIVREQFLRAVKEEKLETIGMPKVNITKLAPNNDIEFTAIVALIPEVKLPKFSSIKVTPETPAVTDEKLQETLDNLRKLRATEVAKDGVADMDDKLIIDMDMFLDRVPVEDGQAKDYQVYLSEDHYIPGFNKELKGLKKGDEKKFSLPFPDTHYQKNLAGKTVEFAVKVKEVMARHLPELSDEFAKTVGQESMEKMKELLRNNLLEEATAAAEEKTAIAMLDAVIEKTTFAEIPAVIIDAEKQKMFFELKRDLDRHGVTIEQYLQDIKKKEDELLKDFTTQAEKRAKAALLSRTIAKENGLSPSEDEIKEEIKVLEMTYKDNPEYTKQLKLPEVHETIATMVQNRKVMAWLREQILEKK